MTISLMPPVGFTVCQYALEPQHRRDQVAPVGHVGFFEQASGLELFSKQRRSHESA